MAGAHDVLGGSDRTGHDVDLHFQTHAGHAHRIGNAALIVDDVFLRQNVDHLAVQRDGDRLGRIQRTLDVAGRDFTALDGNDAVAVKPLDVTAGDARIHGSDFTSGHQFGFFKRPLDGLHRLLDIDHDTLPQPGGRTRADTDNIHPAVLRGFAHHRTNLGGANIKADYQFRFGHALLLGAFRNACRDIASSRSREIRPESIISGGAAASPCSSLLF